MYLLPLSIYLLGLFWLSIIPQLPTELFPTLPTLHYPGFQLPTASYVLRTLESVRQAQALSTPQSRLACLPCNLGRPSAAESSEARNSPHLLNPPRPVLKETGQQSDAPRLFLRAVYILHTPPGTGLDSLVKSDRRHLPHASSLVIFLEPSWSRSNFLCWSSTLDTTNPFCARSGTTTASCLPTSTYLRLRGRLSSFENPSFREKNLIEIAFCRHSNSPTSPPTITRRPPAGRLGAQYIST